MIETLLIVIIVLLIATLRDLRSVVIGIYDLNQRNKEDLHFVFGRETIKGRNHTEWHMRQVRDVRYG